MEGHNLQLIVTDGCAGLAAALQTVYPRVAHQHCWVHKMRNILETVRKRDSDQVKAGAQALYLARSRWQTQNAFQRFRRQWQSAYPAMVHRLEKDLPELLTFFDFPRHLWQKLRTTNAIERCFVEVRRRTRPMVCFGFSMPSFNNTVPNGKTAPSSFLHKQLDIFRHLIGHFVLRPVAGPHIANDSEANRGRLYWRLGLG